MKKIALVIFCVTLVIANVNAQKQYKYKELKKTYNFKEYVRQPGDMYNPAVGGIASFIIPGLGQMIQAEGGRGAGFLVGTVALITVAVVTAPTIDSNGNIVEERSPGVSVVAFLGAAGVSIWSIVDAVRVAKVKNLAYRDNAMGSIKLEVDPYFGTINGVEGAKSNIGLSLKLKL